mgnify:CR=1 FL=1
MQQLGTLIRLNKLTVDERRRAVADARNVLEQLQEERAKLDRELAAEKAVAGASLMGAMTLAGYLKQARLRRDAIDRSIVQALEEVAEAEEALAIAFQELKRYELAQEERDRQRKQELARRETQKFDEIGSMRFHRQQAEGEGGGPPDET